MEWKRLIKSFVFALAITFAAMLVERVIGALVGFPCDATSIVAGVALLALAYGKASWDQLQDERRQHIRQRKRNQVRKKSTDRHQNTLG